MADVAHLPDLPLPRWPRRDGTYPAGPGPEIHDHAQLYELISIGRTVAVLPESCRVHLRPADHAAVPVPDAPTVTTVIAWPPHSRSRSVADLVRAAAHVGDRSPRASRTASPSGVAT
jgi:hypothetical protein